MKNWQVYLIVGVSVIILLAIIWFVPSLKAKVYLPTMVKFSKPCNINHGKVCDGLYFVNPEDKDKRCLGTCVLGE